MKKKKMIVAIGVVVLVVVVAVTTIVLLQQKKDETAREGWLTSYHQHITEKNYDAMYEMLEESSKNKYDKETFITRNKNIYEGIEVSNVITTIMGIKQVENTNKYAVSYHTTLSTIAGEVSYDHTATIVKEKKEYKLIWSSKMIFPTLGEADKVKVKTLTSKRGSILDRNGVKLATEGTVSAIGFVPGKMGQNKEESIQKVATLLEVAEETIRNGLNASYVKDDTFVQIKRIQSGNEELMNQLLEIPGIKIIDSKARVYPLGAAASHLTGYVQSISQEELDTVKDKGYTATSLIGKIGLEKVYEERLRGIDGAEIDIFDNTGTQKEVIAKRELKHGEDIKTTIDATLQNKVYTQLQNEQGLFVMMNPKTGEMLTLVSTPSYDANDFIVGMSSKKWNEMNENPSNPLLNRYVATWSPGSTFKPIVGAIGLTTGTLDQNKEYEHSGLSYQKNTSWGDYKITTLKEYQTPANLRNALMFSDNIYFAKVAMEIGGETLANSFNKIGFNESVLFPQNLAKSTYADNNTFASEIQLADTGYGQGKVLVNPIHMASIYSAFVNEGSMVKPYLEYKEDKTPEFVKEGVFSKETASTIRDDLVQVVEGTGATASGLKINGVKIAAKTGTAELKKDKTETNGEELSWLNAFSADGSAAKQYLMIGMRKITKNNPGTNTLFPLIKELFR